MTSSIDVFVNRQVSILTTDGRHYTGTFVGFDQATNLILANSKLLIWEEGVPKKEIETHSQVIRGDTLATIFLHDSDTFPESAEALESFKI